MDFAPAVACGRRAVGGVRQEGDGVQNGSGNGRRETGSLRRAGGAMENRELPPLPAKRRHQQSEEKQQDDQAADDRARHGGVRVRISDPSNDADEQRNRRS